MIMNQIHTTIKGGKVVAGDFVRWDRTTNPCHGNPTDTLSPSEIYRIVDIEDHSFYTTLILQQTSTGYVFEEGFNAVLFTKVEVSSAVSPYKPEVGARYEISKVFYSNGKLICYPGYTSKVIAKYPGSNSTWYVVTRNSVYNVMVIPTMNATT